MPVAKAKIMALDKKRHEKAIHEFEIWCYRHPEATLKERINAFDVLIDTFIEEEQNANVRSAC